MAPNENEQKMRGVWCSESETELEWASAVPAGENRLDNSAEMNIHLMQRCYQGHSYRNGTGHSFLSCPLIERNMKVAFVVGSLGAKGASSESGSAIKSSNVRQSQQILSAIERFLLSLYILAFFSSQQPWGKDFWIPLLERLSQHIFLNARISQSKSLKPS